MKDEDQLIWRAQHLADAEAFSKLVTSHQGALRAFLVRLCKRYDLADDLAQDSFLAAYRKIATFNRSGSFKSWLYRIAYNCFLQHIRSESRRTEVTLDYSEQYLVLAEKYASVSTQQLDLEKAMALLKREEIAAITLAYSVGLTHEEIAEILESPIGTIKTHILRGKGRLTQILSAPGSEPEERQ